MNHPPRWRCVEKLEDRVLLASDLVINEFLASNQHGLLDQDGDTSDWIEILNTGATSISLDQYSLSDDDGNLTKWQFPAISLAAGETLLVFASGKDRSAADSELHTNFRLAVEGEFLGLIEPDQTIASSYAPSYPTQATDVSYGLAADGVSQQYFATPTPNAPNAAGNSHLEPPAVVINEIMYHPASDNPADEFLELLNRGSEAIELGGWQLVNGVQFVFPSYMLPAGETVVVAADSNQFRQTYGDRDNLVGGWNQKLSDGGETLELVDANGRRVDRVAYSDEGDWAERIRGEMDRNHEGWEWSDAHDGQGRSLELRNPTLDNNVGQNWTASANTGGTPGATNSVATSDAAPLIEHIAHSPIIPSSHDAVLIQARIHDEQPAQVTAALHWRIDGAASFQTAAMRDDGQDGDAQANDGVFVAMVPAQADGAVVEFFVSATDASQQTRRYPNVAESLENAPHLLYQVDNQFAHESDSVAQDDLYRQPIFRLIMTEAERAEIADIGSGSDAHSNAQMNGTFVSYDGTTLEHRYQVGIRNRGKGSRNDPPNNYRVNFANDQPWSQVKAINLNSKMPFAQVLGSAFHAAAGVIVADATAVQVRVNGEDLSVGDPKMYGSYNYLEVINSEFTDRHYPYDADGNIYRGGWVSRNQADLRDEGDDPDVYRGRYSKDTNVAEDDWSDLLQLIDVLNNAELDSLLAEVEQIADVDQWLRFLATDTLLANRETSPSNGIGDDYRLYRGQNDQRFVFIPHDFDSILGVTNRGVDYDIWLPSEMNGLSRLLSLPQVAQRYYANLLDLIETTFAPDNASRTIEQVLGSWVPEATRNDLRRFIADRIENVLSQIPQALTVAVDLPVQNGLATTNGPMITLTGTAPAARTARVEINGMPAAYDVQAASWTVTTTAERGLNRYHVVTYDEQGQATHRTSIDVLRNPSGTTLLSGTLTEDLVLSADQIWQVESDLIVPDGRSLQIDPGTLVTVASGTTIRVEGQLVAQANELHPVRFTRTETSGTWDGLQFVNTQAANRLDHVDLAYSDGNDQSILVDHARLDMNAIRWFETLGTSLEVLHPTLTVTNSEFPTVVDNETVHGSGLSGDEKFILQGNTFGTTTGYSDIVDFTGGQRPGPILQVIGNTFTGGSDDGLDLDGTDAYIAGNVFRSIRKDNTSDSSSNAIATGVDSGNASELVIVGNVFYDVDHALLLKERSSAVFENNLVIQATDAGINMDEPNRDVDPGAGITIRNSIFWQTETLLSNIDADTEFGVPDIRVDHSLVPEAWLEFGTGNFVGDPSIVDFETFALRPDSPALGAGHHGMDLGVHVPRLTAMVTGEPAAETDAAQATLHVFGADIVSYRYRLANTGEPWSPVTNVSEPIQLSDLNVGTYAVEVIGIDSRGLQQAESTPTVSKSWTVQSEPTPIWISEVYANSGVGETPEANGDWIELYNPNTTNVDLSGMSLTDDVSTPRKFVFPTGTELAAGQYLQVPSFAVGEELATQIRWNSQGDAVYLYGRDTEQPVIVDQVAFGKQLPEYSIGRVGSDGDWSLTQPTPNAANRRQPTGSVSQLQINEWFTSGDVRLTSDFVEIANPDPLPVDLSGLFLTDNPVGWPDRHSIPELSFVGANGYTVFWADGDASQGDHLGFRLSQATSQIGLYDADLRRIDAIHYLAQQTDVSEGRVLDGTIARFALPTPSLPNSEQTQVIVETRGLVSLTDVWRYDARGEDLGTTWRDATYDDSAWQENAAPFGLETSTLSVPIQSPLELGPITYYFRTTFEFDGDPASTELFLQTQIDDGAVFYLNGTEGLRINMPTGDVDSETRADNSIGNANLEDAVQVFFDSLIAGTNVLAVEVHQASSTSSDVVFAAGLSASSTQHIDPETNEHRRLLEGLRITELMYHPASNENLEFVELRNTGGTELHLAGVRLAGGIDYVLGEETLAAGEVLVVAKDVTAFQQVYGTSVRVVGGYEGNLANSGDSLRLELPVPHQVAIHRFTYGDSRVAGWPSSADGDGRSLEVVNVEGNYRDADNWRASDQDGGTPGFDPHRHAVGDVNADGRINAVDIDLLFGAIATNTTASIYDLDDDGLVQSSDVDQLVNDLLNTTYGDADLDQAVGFADFLALSANFGNTGGWSDGDFSGDGHVDFADFLLLSSNFGKQTSRI